MLNLIFFLQKMKKFLKHTFFVRVYILSSQVLDSILAQPRYLLEHVSLNNQKKILNLIFFPESNNILMYALFFLWRNE